DPAANAPLRGYRPMIFAALVDTRLTYRFNEYPRLPTISVYISATRGSTPALPPVVSSIRTPCSFFASVQQISSVAMQFMHPSNVPAQSAAWSSVDFSDGYV